MFQILCASFLEDARGTQNKRDTAIYFFHSSTCRAEKWVFNHLEVETNFDNHQDGSGGVAAAPGVGVLDGKASPVRIDLGQLPYRAVISNCSPMLIYEFI